jgi:hypothetical protein
LYDDVTRSFDTIFVQNGAKNGAKNFPDFLTTALVTHAM